MPRHRLTLPSPEQVARLNDRVHPEQAPGFRSETQRDRDRILYSSAFQRLGGVTQVSASEPGHTFHTRLTHSLKVAQFARRGVERFHRLAERGELDGAARFLAETLDADAAESTALGHDLGHPPFGHVGEQALKAATGGNFEGNAQSIRILTRLSARTERSEGLNLTRQTLNGTLKYPWFREETDEKKDDKWGAYRTDEGAFRFAREDSVENEPAPLARLMDWADDVTYAVHDVDDFFRAGLVPLDRLKGSDTELARFGELLASSDRVEDVDAHVAALEDVLRFFPLREAYDGRLDQRIALRGFGSRLITTYMNALSLQAGDDGGTAELVIEDAAAVQVAVLKELTWEYVVMRPSLAVLQHGHRRIVETLYTEYLDATAKDPRLIPPAFQHRLEGATPAARSYLAADLVASLTESAALELFGRITGTNPGSMLDAAARVA